MNIGDILHTSAEREDAPIGAVIVLQDYANSRINTWTKTSAEEWTNERGHPRAHNGRLGWAPDTDPTGYVVTSWPTAEPTLVMAVGDRLYTGAQREAAPIGARIRAESQTGNRWWTKTGSDQWTRESDGSTRPNLTAASGGWYGDQPEGSFSYYEVLEWPVTNTPTTSVEVSSVSDYASLLALPVGAVFCASTQPEVQWQVEEGQTCIRVGGAVRVRLDLSVFEGPANAGALRTGEPVPTVAHLSVGQTITERQQFEDLPVGTTIAGTAGVVRTKDARGVWVADGRPDRPTERLRLHYHVVQTLPVAIPDLLAVGEGIQTYEQAAAMPVGTVIRGGFNQWTKMEDGWAMHQDGVPQSPHGSLADTSLTLDGYNVVVSYPDSTIVLNVGTTLTSTEQFAALPVGSVVTNGDGVRWVKRPSGDWGPPDAMGDYPNAAMNVGSWWTVTSVGPEVTRGVGDFLRSAEQLDALPVGTVIRWVTTTVLRTRTEEGWAGQAGGRPLASTGLSFDRNWMVESLPGVAAPSGEVTVTVAEAEAERTRAINDATTAARREGEAAGREAAREEFLSTLREHWDGDNFNENEINLVLSDLGLEEIDPDRTESVTVTVTVEGRTTLDTSGVEDMIEGDLDARLDADPMVDWTISGLDFDDIEVPEGDCACDQIEERMVRDRLRENSVSFDTFSFEGSCPNC